MIYLDNSATTQPCEACVRAMTELLTDCWGNPSSVHAHGIAAHHRLRQAREQVASALGAEPDRVFFTSGGTEADNWAIFSAAERLGKRGHHIVTTAVEHHAVLHPMQKLEAKGFEVTYLQPDREGNITVDALKKALRPDTILVSVMMVNNETGAVMPIADMVRATRRLSPLALFHTDEVGAVQPIAEMARVTHRKCPNAIFHTDAVQGFLKVPFRARTLGADMISVSAHKIHAAKGTGALYIRPGLPLPPFLCGGGQESNYRSGTENMPGICGFGAAWMASHPPASTAAAANARQRRRACNFSFISESLLSGFARAQRLCLQIYNIPVTECYVRYYSAFFENVKKNRQNPAAPPENDRICGKIPPIFICGMPLTEPGKRAIVKSIKRQR